MPGCTDFFAKYKAMLALQEKTIAKYNPCREAWVRISFLTKFAKLEEEMRRASMGDLHEKECFYKWNATLLDVRSDRPYQERLLSYAVAACHTNDDEVEKQSPAPGQ